MKGEFTVTHKTPSRARGGGERNGAEPQRGDRPPVGVNRRRPRGGAITAAAAALRPCRHPAVGCAGCRVAGRGRGAVPGQAVPLRCAPHRLLAVFLRRSTSTRRTRTLLSVSTCSTFPTPALALCAVRCLLGCFSLQQKPLTSTHPESHPWLLWADVLAVICPFRS